MSLRRLRKSDVRELEALLPIALDKKDDVQRGDDVIIINDRLSFIKHDTDWIPAIPLLQEQPLLPVVIVDMGAVPHVARGADIMRPGITQLPSAPQDSLVVIVDERHEQPLAVGRLLRDAKDVEAESEGRVIKTLHHVGDAFWKQYAH